MRLAAFLFCLCLGGIQQALACESSPSVEAWSCYEVTFTASSTYGHALREVTSRVTFAHSSGEQIAVDGFWDGGQSWRARTAFPLTGQWSWTSSSSDAGIDGQTGTVTVTEATGTDPFRTRGWLRASANQRYLEYEDGTPFFYLGDTAWEAAWAATQDEFSTYIENRRVKGFNVVHIVVSTHQYNYSDHITNASGQPFLLGTDRSRLNPRYFDTVDRYVEQANAAGMAVALVPLWATYASVHSESTNHVVLVSPEESLIWASYIGARYSGDNVIWLVGGDQYYNTEERRAYWDAFARRLRTASGGRHMMTAHTGGYSGSFNFWPTAPDWLDFHMYQGSHYDSPRYQLDPDGRPLEDAYGSLSADGGFSWSGALQGYHMESPRPVLNAEANYEDLFGRFWEFADTTEGRRLTDVDVRQAAYWGLLSGSTVGYAYGANGVWQWTQTITPGGFWARYSVLDALNLPGSSSMYRMRQLAEANNWSQWEPRPDLAHEIESDHFVPAALGPDRLVAYAPTGTSRFALDIPDSFGTNLSVVWSSATSDAEVRASVQGSGRIGLTPPDDQDWLVVVRRAVPSSGSGGPTEELPATRLVRAGPNPTRDAPVISVGASESASWLRVYDAIGREVYARSIEAGAEARALALPLSTPGTYVVRLSTTGETAAAETLRITVVR